MGSVPCPARCPSRTNWPRRQAASVGRQVPRWRPADSVGPEESRRTGLWPKLPPPTRPMRSGLGVPPLGVAAVGVVVLLGRVGGVGLVDAGELRVVVAAVGAVAVSGLGVSVLVGQGFDVGVAVVAVEAVLARPVGVVLDLGEPFTPRAVLVRLGQLIADLLVEHLTGQTEVLVVRRLAGRCLRRHAVQRVEGVRRGLPRACGVRLLRLHDMVEAVVHAPSMVLPPLVVDSVRPKGLPDR